ncbi:MAG TPA: plastocyanin/azurin family copper-binding protein, partial [Rhodanobacteraceae bacterium]|nr:plastocyanin/azurin family copper-binding protein [Rhodanobacteraceae bacterium]
MRAVVYGIGVAVLLLVAIRSQAADHQVNVGGTSVRFDPQDITINVGDTVTWVSSSAQPHNVHANDNSFRCAAGCDGDGHGGDGGPRIGPWSATVAFPHAGTFGYQCDPHAAYGMVGAVHVVEGGGGSSFVPITHGFTGAWYD